MEKAFLNWSSGKDAAFVLFETLEEKSFSIDKLVTTLNSKNDRVSMHGLSKDLLMRQTHAIGLPLHIISLDGVLSAPEYDRLMREEVAALEEQGFSCSVFGDIFLEDIRAYREEQLKDSELRAVFPLWKRDTASMIRDFISAGFKAITVSVNAKVLDASFCGRIIDEQFLTDLPAGVDPCGENGEFHTFVFDGPIFNEKVGFKKGELVQKTYSGASDADKDGLAEEERSWDTSFWYMDLLPESQ